MIQVALLTWFQVGGIFAFWCDARVLHAGAALRGPPIGEELGPEAVIHSLFLMAHSGRAAAQVNGTAQLARPVVRASCVAMCGARCADSPGHLGLHRAS